MAASDLAVAVLWHMHQPDYVDARTGRALMPWVRLHALTSYYDMARLARETPEARAVFNVVPILLRQIDAAAAGEVEDEFLRLARAAPGDLSAADRQRLLRHFFAFHHGRRFAELPRLGELWRKREALGPQPAARLAAAFSDAELRDLQVGFLLAWSGRSLREEPLAAALLRKGRNFTAGEKQELLDLQQVFLGRVLPAYRELATGGVCEVSVTPFAHPILPLLCDLRAAHEARPELPLPAASFARPGDAWHQVQTALEEAERLLGVRPGGMWPSEGAISDEAVRICAAAGVRWLASDQDVLAASVAGGAAPAGGHFRPYRLAGLEAPVLFFRDHHLSDRIGFVYSTWPAARAAADLVAQLQRIRAALPRGRFLVPIILDGENAWEAYPGHGTDFLRALYAGVAAAPGCRWTTFEAFLAETDGQALPALPHLRAGSWIRSDLTTWIGHPAKNRAWELLAATRAWLEPRLAEAGALRAVALPGGRAVSAPDPAVVGPAADTPLARAWHAMVGAEGSDWFWWYGDDHPTAFATEFDELFRLHLANVHHNLGEPCPAMLHETLLAEAGARAARPPRAPLEITLDGRVTHYYEWLDAGCLELADVGGAMHRAAPVLAAAHYGADARRLLLRLDPAAEGGGGELAGCSLCVRSGRDGAEAARLRLPEAGDGAAALIPAPLAAGPPPAELAGCRDRVIEAAVPWALLGAAAGEECTFFLTLERDGLVALRIPATGTLSVRVPAGPGDSDDWLV